MRNCKQCEEKFVTEKDLKHHIVSAHERNFDCHKCPGKFHFRGHLKTHLENVHSSNLPVHHRSVSVPRISIYGSKATGYSCPVCGKVYKCKNSVKSHKISVHDRVRYQCQVCQFSFGAKSALNTHMMRVHAKNRRFQCLETDCPYAATFQSELRKHKETVHGTERPYKCKKCPKAFKRNEPAIFDIYPKKTLPLKALRTL